MTRQKSPRMILVTGVSGSGKTTIAAHLQELGIEAYDADDGLTGWEDKEGIPIDPSTQMKNATPEWYAAHDWNMSRDKLRDIKAAAQGEVVYICGGSSNEYELIDEFDEVVYLTLDEGTLKKRIVERTDNSFGKQEHEMQNILEWRVSVKKDWEELGAMIIDASRSLEEVIEEILTHARA